MWKNHLNQIIITFDRRLTIPGYYNDKFSFSFKILKYRKIDIRDLRNSLEKGTAIM